MNSSLDVNSAANVSRLGRRIACGREEPGRISRNLYEGFDERKTASVSEEGLRPSRAANIFRQRW
jgi:hypothetical protein